MKGRGRGATLLFTASKLRADTVLRVCSVDGCIPKGQHFIEDSSQPTYPWDPDGGQVGRERVSNACVFMGT